LCECGRWLGSVCRVAPVAGHRARRLVRKVSMPHLVGVFGERNALDLALTPRVEETEVDTRRIRGEQREIDAETIPCRAERIRTAFGNPRPAAARFLTRPHWFLRGLCH